MIPGWVAKYVGIPFAEKGESIHGANCWTLARMVLQQEFSIELPDYDAEYYSTTDTETTAVWTKAVAFWVQEERLWVEVDDPALGDLLFFRVAELLHCGVCLDEVWMLHVIRGANASLARYRDHPLWKHRFRGAYRYTGSAYHPG